VLEAMIDDGLGRVELRLRLLAMPIAIAAATERRLAGPAAPLVAPIALLAVGAPWSIAAWTGLAPALIAVLALALLPAPARAIAPALPGRAAIGLRRRVSDRSGRHRRCGALARGSRLGTRRRLPSPAAASTPARLIAGGRRALRRGRRRRF